MDVWRSEDIFDRIYRIHDVELLSTGWTTRNYPDAIRKLDSIANKANSLIGIVAYHTLGLRSPITDAGNLLSCLKQPESYLCVGWKEPTNFKGIDELSVEGVKFHIDVVKSSKFPSDLDPISNNLLHSKILLFDNADNKTSTLVVGSHNWTRSALTGTSLSDGLNHEDSIIITADKLHPIVLKARKRITETKSKCIEYNSTDKKAFERLQGINGSRIMVEITKRLPNSCSELIILFSDRKASAKFNLDKDGYLFDKTSGDIWKFTSDGSVSSIEVALKIKKRSYAIWDDKKPLVPRRKNTGSPLPTYDFFAILSIKQRKKGTVRFIQNTRPGQLWKGAEEVVIPIENHDIDTTKIKILRLTELPDFVDEEIGLGSVAHMEKYTVKE
jgi:phosphatidylserine/phosphatidylglycerophosphate/cardiolipin synthase-like enzyme